MKTDTAPTISVGQMKELTSAIVEAIPTDLPADIAQYWIGNKRVLGERIRRMLVVEISDLVADWQSFYKKYFEINVDFSKLKIPETESDFDRLIVVAKGFTPNQVFEVCQKNFSCWRYTEDLDKETKEQNDREPTEHYTIWLRDEQEADEKFKNMSADILKKKNIKGITLLEHLIFELKFWDETGKHLDEKNITLCAGSRLSGVRVPSARWDDGWFEVGWYSPHSADPDLRARAVVSF